MDGKIFLIRFRILDIEVYRRMYNIFLSVIDISEKRSNDLLFSPHFYSSYPSNNLQKSDSFFHFPFLIPNNEFIYIL